MVILSILIALAALFNAVMDSLETEISFNASRFSTYDKNFWCKPFAANARGFIPFTRYRLDAWHIAKSLMLFHLITGIALAPWILPPVTGELYLDVPIVTAALGFLWIGVFNFFYRVFKTKE